MGPLDPAPNPDARFTRDLAAARGGAATTVWDLLALCRGYLLEVAAARLAPGLRAKANPSDLVHETLLEAHRDFAQFRGRTEAEWLGWLRRLLVHNLANFERAYFGTAKRQARREVGLAEAGAVPAPGPGPGSAVLIGEREKSVERALADLPDEYRLVILWHCRDDLSFDEIGARLGRSADAARRLWSRAVDRLQDVVSRHERTG